MSAIVRIEGGCLCGAIRYEIDGPIPPGAYCHCNQCRRSTGSVAAAWVSVPREHFRYVRGKPAIYRSSPQAERSFCPACGSPLTFFTDRSPEDIDVTVGTLDDPDQHPPDRHVFTARRLPWLHLDDELPDYDTWTETGHGSPPGD